MTNLSFRIKFKELLQPKDTGHNRSTQFELVGNILDRIKINNTQTFAVFYTIEFVIVLLEDYGIDPKNIWLFGDSPEKEKVAKYLKINYNSINILDGKKFDMKFNVVLGNPPFAERGENNKTSTNTTDLSLPFTQKAFELVEDYVAFIIPSDWTGPNRSSLKNMLFESYKLKNITLHGDKWFDVQKDTLDFLFDKKHTGDCLIEDVKGKKMFLKLDNKTILSNENIQTKLLKKFDLTNNLGSYWHRGSVNANDMVEVVNGIEIIETVGRKNEPLKTKIISNKETCGLGEEGLVIGNLGESGGIGNIKTKKKSQVGGHSVVFLFTSYPDNLKQYLESKLIKYLVSCIKKSTPNSKSLFENLPEIDFSKKYTDQDLYNLFGINDAEQKLINSRY
jgi:hypothetical protein